MPKVNKNYLAIQLMVHLQEQKEGLILHTILLPIGNINIDLSLMFSPMPVKKRELLEIVSFHLELHLNRSRWLINKVRELGRIVMIQLRV